MSRLLSISIPDELAAEVETLALSTGKITSDIVRDALRRHIQHERFVELQRHGRNRVEAHGIAPEEVERLTDELRAAVAGQRVLDAPDMQVPAPVELSDELEALRDRRA